MLRACLLLVLFLRFIGPQYAVALTFEERMDSIDQLKQALDQVPADQREGMEFLISHMPERDLNEVTADFLLENVDLAYQAWRESPWKSQVSEELFLNNVLPYASINERRDNWRKTFYKLFAPMVKDAKTPGEAAVILNNKMYEYLNVKYSTKRAKADQSPFETMESGLASCTGLSILLIDACRAVGVPARFVGTPLWSDRSGNHSWVEVWDDGWHFTGAAEPTGEKLDEGWFVERATRAKVDEPLHAIYATSFKKTPVKFPCVWDRRIDYISAVNVTERYTSEEELVPEGHAMARFRTIDEDGRRIRCQIEVADEAGDVCFTGKTRDEGFDSNDHLSTPLLIDKNYVATAMRDGQSVRTCFLLSEGEQLFTMQLARVAGSSASETPIDQLMAFLSAPQESRDKLDTKPFAQIALSKEQAETAFDLLWEDHMARVRETRKSKFEAGKLSRGELTMPFFYRVFGEKPAGGRSLFISMHGGGGAPKEVNDRQWKNQQTLYEPAEGVYLAPRAPTDTWNLWHQDHIDSFFDQLISDLIVLEDVNPNRVYLMGYSAGGDGAYQLAPRMADRWAAVSMMAGHPNDTSPLGLRNIGFAIYMGGLDSPYKRNEVAAQWKEELAKLREKDPKGYYHQVTIYADKGHWMDGEDASAIEWMQKQSRNPLPEKVIWKQDDVTHSRYYWLANPNPEPGSLVVATRAGQSINIESNEVTEMSVRLNDRMLDLDQPVRITCADRVLFEGMVPRTIAVIARTLQERGDPQSVFASSIDVNISKKSAN